VISVEPLESPHLCTVRTVANTHTVDTTTLGTPGDIWSYGVVLWELITLEMPHSTLIPPIIIFGGGQGLLHLPVPLETPETIQELLAGCWKVEPDDRPTASKLLRRLDVLNEEQESEASLKMVEVIRSRSRWQDEVRRVIHVLHLPAPFCLPRIEHQRQWIRWFVRMMAVKVHFSLIPPSIQGHCSLQSHVRCPSAPHSARGR
jgi:serine/threonine protein kinase